MKNWFKIWQASRRLERYLTQWPMGKSRWRDARLPVKGGEVHARLTAPPRTTGWVIATRPENGPVGAWLLNWAGLATLRVDLQGQAPAEMDGLGERLLAVTAWLRAQPEYTGQPVGYLGLYGQAAPVLWAAGAQPQGIAGVVAVGGDYSGLTAQQLAAVTAPTLLLADRRDRAMLFSAAYARRWLGGRRELLWLPGEVERYVARLATAWLLETWRPGFWKQPAFWQRRSFSKVMLARALGGGLSAVGLAVSLGLPLVTKTPPPARAAPVRGPLAPLGISSLALSSLDGTTGFRLDRFSKFDELGFSVSGAGDVNGDGFDDLIVGAPYANSYAGESYVVFGKSWGWASSPALSSLDGTTGFRLDGIDEGDKSGFSVSGAGDVNGDNVDDLIIGAPYANNNTGESYVVFGKSWGWGSSLALSSLDGTTGFRLDGIDGGDRSGFSVSGAGDVNKDGADDLIIGAPDANSNAGESYVVFGKSWGWSSSLALSSLDGTTGFRLDGIGMGDFSGFSVSGARDVNGDNVDDLIIGAPEADPGGNFSAGESYVVFGKSGFWSSSLVLSSLDGTTGFRMDGVDKFDNSGFSVSGAGDVNRDNIDDLIVGAPDANNDTGESYVVFGKSGGWASSLALSSLDSSTGFRLDGIDGGDRSGFSVSGAGDVNRDNIDDLIVGAPDANSNAGESYVVFGKSNWSGLSSLALSSLDGTTGFRLDGISQGDRSGFSVSGAGDVNKDGVDDLIIGAPLANDYGGESYVVFGKSGGWSSSLALSGLDGTTGFRLEGIQSGKAGDARSGFSVSEAGDVNGDGFDDLIVGVPDANNNTGESYVVFGKSGGWGSSLELSGLDGSTGFRMDGVENGPAKKKGGDNLSVSGAGDVNGDGFDDLIVGAPDANNYAGESYVVFGKSGGWSSSLALSGLDGATGFRLDGVDEYDESGLSVSGAGDVNGDGFDDLIVGAPYADLGNGYDASVSYVVFGKSGDWGSSLALSGLDGATGFRMDGVDSGAAKKKNGPTLSVSEAGDVNGDGFDDLIVGAPDANNDTGESYVVFGKNGGWASNLALSGLDGSTGFRLDGIDKSDFSGRSVSGAGDVNGDGIADLIVGAPDANNDAGESYVVFGENGAWASSLALSSLNGTTGFRLDGVDQDDHSGWSVSGAGDVNGDGFDDLIVGAPYAAFDAGESYVVFGGDGFSESVTHQGGAGNDDPLNGSSGADVIVGGLGDDNLGGLGGDDVLKGGAGDDTLTGGAGDDILDGGSGSDTYVFGDNWGNDVVLEDHVRGNTDGGDRFIFVTSADLDVDVGSISVTDGGGNTVFYRGTDVESITGGSGDDTFSVTSAGLLKTGGLTLDGDGGGDTLIFDPQGEEYSHTPTGGGSGTITVGGVTLTYQGMEAVKSLPLPVGGQLYPQAISPPPFGILAGLGVLGSGLLAALTALRRRIKR